MDIAAHTNVTPLLPPITHYVPFFVEAHLRRAACGVVVFSKTHSTEPTCPRCAAWLESDPAQAAALEQLWDADRAAHGEVK